MTIEMDKGKLVELKKDELLQLATESGVVGFNSKTNKDDLINLILAAHQKEKETQGPAQPGPGDESTAAKPPEEDIPQEFRVGAGAGNPLPAAAPTPAFKPCTKEDVPIPNDVPGWPQDPKVTTVRFFYTEEITTSAIPGTPPTVKPVELTPPKKFDLDSFLEMKRDLANNMQIDVKLIKHGRPKEKKGPQLK